MSPSADALNSSGGPEGLQRWVERADALRAGHAFTEAAREYRTILAAYPNDRPSQRGLAATLIAEGDTSSAIPLLEQLLRDDPNDLETWRERAAIFRASGNHRELLRSLQAIERLDSRDRAATLEEYQLLDVAGASEEAYRCLDRVLQGSGEVADGPSRSRLLLEKGILAEKLDRSEDAESAYEAAGATNEPEVVRDAASRGARLALKNGRPDLALTILAAAIPTLAAGGEPPADLLRLRATTLLQVDRPEEAEQIFDQLRARDPADGDALAGAARARIGQGKHPEAREILHDGLRQVPRTEPLVLALAEAESGSGDLLAAERAVREGVELVPTSRALWTRLAEIASARSDWETATDAYRHAMELDPTSVEGILGAAFVAEQKGHSSEAMALYQRAAEVAPGDVRVWTRRGLALAAAQRHADAVESFDRALAIDPESDAAREGKKVADRERRARETDAYGLAALRLESQVGRPVTKNDLFVRLKVPFDQLDPALSAVSREAKVDVASLEPTDFADLEERSCRLITGAMDRRPPGIESRGLTVVDVAVLSVPSDSLTDVQRLFAYVDTVLRMDIRPENLRLTSQAEDVARKALQLPIAQRTLFGLVRTLQIGIFQARVVKAVERASDSAHPPLPSVNLASHSPEFGGADEHADGAQFFSPENLPAAAPGSGRGARTSGHSRLWPLGVPPLETQKAAARDRGTARCIACGGIASFTHGCGATLCSPCTRQFARCPKCGGSFIHAAPTFPAPSRVTASPSRPARPPAVRSSAAVAVLPHEAGVAAPRSKTADRTRASLASADPSRGSETKNRPGSVRRSGSNKEEPDEPKGAPSTKEPTLPRGTAGSKATPVTPPAALPAPRVRRDRPDDEPRL